jgi:hypothetical protein
VEVSRISGRGHCVTQSDTFPQIEGDRNGGQLAEVVDSERADATADFCDRAKRHELAASGTNEKLGQRLGVALEFRQQFHDDPVLIDVRKDGRDLALAISAVERVLNLVSSNAQGTGFVAVNLHPDLGTADEQVAGHVLETIQLRQAVLHDGPPAVKFLEVGPLQG